VVRPQRRDAVLGGATAVTFLPNQDGGNPNGDTNAQRWLRDSERNPAESSWWRPKRRHERKVLGSAVAGAFLSESCWWRLERRCGRTAPGSAMAGASPAMRLSHALGHSNSSPGRTSVDRARWNGERAAMLVRPASLAAIASLAEALQP
jgi:hypothetical protein